VSKHENIEHMCAIDSLLSLETSHIFSRYDAHQSIETCKTPVGEFRYPLYTLSLAYSTVEKVVEGRRIVFNDAIEMRDFLVALQQLRPSIFESLSLRHFMNIDYNIL
jgi:hypothetical protein